MSRNTEGHITQKNLENYWAKPNRLIRVLIDAYRTEMTSIEQRAKYLAQRLVSDASLLERRVGLVKYHADRQAAHITLQTYLFHTLDLVHVVAAIAVVGAMIIEFDDKTRGNQYFDAIDEAAWQAATSTFPGMSGKRLFHSFNIHHQARAFGTSKDSMVLICS